MAFFDYKNFIKDRSGSTAVEFAIVGMGFIFFVFMIFELGFMYWTWNTLQFAVENATRYVLTNEDLTDEEIKAYVRDNMPGFNTDDDNPFIVVERETSSGVNFIQVSATYDYEMFSTVLPQDFNGLDFTATSRLAIP